MSSNTLFTVPGTPDTFLFFLSVSAHWLVGRRHDAFSRSVFPNPVGSWSCAGIAFSLELLLFLCPSTCLGLLSSPLS